MKKILLAFDGANFSEGAFEFARQLNQVSPVLLTGVFLPQINYSSLWSYSAGAAASGPIFIPLIEDADAAVVDNNIDHFELMCIKNKIQHKVHKDFTDFALPGLKKETRFADLLILGSESFYEYMGAHDPNDYLRDALHRSECPVLLVPEKFVFPEKNILAYDGSESSVYAIKQFAYLFPELVNNETLLVYAHPEEGKELPEENFIKDWANRHFSNLSLLKLDSSSPKHFASWMSDKKGAILISGGYGRSFVSQMFKKSYVSDVIKAHQLPVFITHR